MHSILFVCRLGLAAVGVYLVFANYREQSESFQSFPPIGLAVSPNQELVAAIFEGGAITVFNLKEDNKATELDILYHEDKWWFNHDQRFVGPRTAFLGNHRLLVVSTEHRDEYGGTRRLTLIEWDISDNQQISEQQFEHVVSWAICASREQVAMQFYPPDSSSEVSPLIGSLKVWDIQARQFTAEITPIQFVGGFTTTNQFVGGRLAMSYDGSRLVAYNRENVQIYDLADDDSEPVNEAQTNIEAVDANSGAKLVTRYDRGPNRYTNALALVTDNRTFALENSADEPKKWSQFFGSSKYVTSSQGLGVRVWATDDGRTLGVYECPYQHVISLVGSDAGERVVIGRYGAIIVWDLISGKTSELWSPRANRTYFERFGGWLGAVICLAVAIVPGLNLNSFNGHNFLDSLSGMFLRLSLVLYSVSLAAPALNFTELDGSTTMIRGFHALSFGWTAVLIGQFAWLSNPCIAIGLIAAMCRAWTTAFVFGWLAVFLTLNTITLFLRPLFLPGIYAPGTGGQLSELAVGYFLWCGAMVSFCGCAAIQLRRASRSAQKIAPNH